MMMQQLGHIMAIEGCILFTRKTPIEKQGSPLLVTTVACALSRVHPKAGVGAVSTLDAAGASELLQQLQEGGQPLNLPQQVVAAAARSQASVLREQQRSMSRRVRSQHLVQQARIAGLARQHFRGGAGQGPLGCRGAECAILLLQGGRPGSTTVQQAEQLCRHVWRCVQPQRPHRRWRCGSRLQPLRLVYRRTASVWNLQCRAARLNGRQCPCCNGSNHRVQDCQERSNLQAQALVS